MSKGSEKDYKFGQKNNWRRQVWNEIARRVKNTRDAIVLYLAGGQDLDRKVAVEHGFRPDNMIIVEKDEIIARRLRGENKIVIIGDIRHVVSAISFSKIKIGVLYADLCCGLEPDLGILADSIGSETFWDSVFMINLQRGRDPRTKSERELADEYLAESYKKHRAAQYLFLQCLLGFNYSYFREETEDSLSGLAATDRTSGRVRMHLPQTDEEYEFLRGLMRHYGPKFFSYKSGALTLDSVIFQSPFRFQEKRYVESSYDSFWSRSQYFDDAKKQIAAALAIRTMRLSGQLEHSPLA